MNYLCVCFRLMVFLFETCTELMICLFFFMDYIAELLKLHHSGFRLHHHRRKHPPPRHHYYFLNQLVWFQGHVFYITDLSLLY